MDQPPHNTPLLTPAQVAELLQIPEATLAAWRTTGRVKLPFLKLGRAVRYRWADVEQLLHEASSK